MTQGLTLEILQGDYAISSLPPDSGVPPWVFGPGCVTVKIVDDVLSVACLSDRVPSQTDTSSGWTAIKVLPKIDLSDESLMQETLRPVSDAGFSLFVASTFFRDYLFVRRNELPRVKTILGAQGHTIAHSTH